MRCALSIAHKDCRIYLKTSTSYVVFGAFLLIVAFFFQRLVVEYQLRTMQVLQMQTSGALDLMNLTDWIVVPLFQNIALFFLFMLPMVTMRLFAEERRQKTLALLMTQAARPWDIVLGKYMAGLAMMSIMLGLTSVFFGLLQAFGSGAVQGALDWQSIAVGYVGMLLMGAACVAVGLCTSALTDSQIVAVVLGFATLLALYVVGLAARGQHGAWASALTALSIHTHLDAFVHGVVRLCDVTYYLSVAVMCLFATCQIVQTQRWT